MLEVTDTDGLPDDALSVPAGCGPLLQGAEGAVRPLRQQVFEHVRSAGRTARADVARSLSVSPGTVTAVASSLIEGGFLREGLTQDRDGGRGRPRVALEVVPEAGHVVGIKLSDESDTAVLADFAGTILAEATRPVRPGRRSLDQALGQISALLDDLARVTGYRMGDLAALGIGVPGLIDPATQVVRWSPLFDGRETPLATAAGRRLGVPVLIENDVSMLALAELWFGAGRAMSDFAVVTIEGGVGMGLVLGNRLWRGTGGLGMELGHATMQLDGALCRCGRRGCLEAYVADFALVREASTALGQTDRETGPAAATLSRLFEEAKAGNRAARSIFRRAGRYLAAGLSNVAQLFDPPLIILSGAQMRYDFLYADEVLAEMASLAIPGRPAPRVEIHSWGDMVWARGAAARALEHATSAKLGSAA